MATGHRVACIAVLLGAVLCASCSWVPSAPLPIVQVAAPSQPAQRLVIVLPGLGEDMADLERSGIAAAIQRGMPDADVTLALASVRYYLDGGMPKRVHEQVVVPARQRGYKEIWLAGASMGGGGATLYELAYPGEMAGLVLFAPWMGPESLLEEIQQAGGLATWEPGPVPAEVSGFEIAREQWRMIQTWSQEPSRARNVWLVCGTSDSLLPASELLAQVLPPDHYFKNDGIHDWVAWTGPASTIFTKIAADAAATTSGQ
jgi:pimeloyl-ACP methyl ester carboxylesterase